MRKPADPTAPTEPQSGESFYGRWSRRKHLQRSGLPDDDVAPPPVPEAGTPATPQPPEPVLTDADMPALESLGEDDDYSGFLSPGVSEALRSRALRKLFMSPKFNVRDGLDDYDDDYTWFEPLGDTVTCDMRHQMEMAAKRLQDEADAAAAAEEQGALAAGDGGEQRDAAAGAPRVESPGPEAAPQCSAQVAPVAQDEAHEAHAADRIDREAAIRGSRDDG